MNCKHCDSSNAIKFGMYNNIQRFYCKDCKRKFTELDTLPHMQTPINYISSAVSMYYEGLSLNEIKRMLKQIYSCDVSDYGIYGWVERFTKDALKIVRSYHPKVGYVWMVDETVIEIAGRQYWLIDVIDIKSRFLIASHLSPYRRVEDIQETLKEAYQYTGRIPKVIMTDHLQAYVHAIPLTYGSVTKHLQVKKFTSKPNNNIIERMQGTIKSRTKIMRDLKTLESARMIIDGFLVHYNFFRPHETLSKNGDDVTPAYKAEIKFPYCNWEELIRNNKQAKKEALQDDFNVDPLPVIKPTAQQIKRADVQM